MGEADGLIGVAELQKMRAGGAKSLVGVIDQAAHEVLVELRALPGLPGVGRCLHECLTPPREDEVVDNIGALVLPEVVDKTVGLVKAVEKATASGYLSVQVTEVFFACAVDDGLQVFCFGVITVALLPFPQVFVGLQCSGGLVVLFVEAAKVKVVGSHVLGPCCNRRIDKCIAVKGLSPWFTATVQVVRKAEQEKEAEGNPWPAGYLQLSVCTNHSVSFGLAGFASVFTSVRSTSSPTRCTRVLSR